MIFRALRTVALCAALSLPLCAAHAASIVGQDVDAHAAQCSLP